MSSSVRCPLCHAANAADASCCAACGVGLVAQCPSCEAVNPRRALACRVCGWRPLTVADAPAPRPPTPSTPSKPATPATALPTPTPPAPLPQPRAAAPAPMFELIEPRAILTPQEEAALRAGLDDPPAPQWPELSTPARPATNPVVGGLELWADPYAAQPPAPRPARTTDVSLTAKALARQAARRARLAQDAAAAAAPVPRDVLVLEEDDGARRQLCELLGGFGFEVHAAETLDQADALLKTRPFAAAFLDLVLEGAEEGAGLELCYRIKQGGPGGPTAVVVLAAQERPADRVRAALARSDVYLPRPISRGDVARALESCGVRLPADARRR